MAAAAPAQLVAAVVAVGAAGAAGDRCPDVALRPRGAIGAGVVALVGLCRPTPCRACGVGDRSGTGGRARGLADPTLALCRAGQAAGTAPGALTPWSAMRHGDAVAGHGRRLADGTAAEVALPAGRRG